MNAYSKDLRLRVLDVVDRGMSRKEAARTFKISPRPSKLCAHASTFTHGIAVPAVLQPVRSSLVVVSSNLLVGPSL